MSGVCTKKETPIKPDDSVDLAKRFVHASMWMTVIRFVDYIFNAVRLIILARILTPRDFGLFGLCLVAVQTTKVFTKSGFWAALLQKPGEVHPYFDTYFIVSAIRGIILAAVLFAGAGIAAALLAEPDVVPLLRVACICFVAQGLSSPAMANYWRQLRLKKECIHQAVGTVVDLAVAATAAILLRNAWALVLGLVAKNVAQLLLSYILAPYRITGACSLPKARELFHFGGWILVASILLFLLEHGTMLFIGRGLGVSELGFYLLAYQIGNRPTREIINVLARPAFVAFSKLQSETQRLRQGYLKTFQLVSFTTIPISVILAILANNIVAVFFGQDWMHMVGVLRFLALWSGVQSLNVIGYSLLKGTGQPGVEARFRFVQILLMAAMIWPLSHSYGLSGIGLALLASELAASSMLLPKLHHTIGLHPRLQFRLILLPAVASVFMVTAIFYSGIFFSHAASLSSLGALAGIGILVYAGCTLVIDHVFNYGLVSLIWTHIIRVFFDIESQAKINQ